MTYFYSDKCTRDD